ncbi:MAG: aminoglycoside phosphotransferase family protein [Phycisphaerae bacterium]|nr:aminoglycoside phosphotransferase family protein [Phycisphaerae bacterium]
MEHDIRSIASQFQLDGALVDTGPLGSGHINDTYGLTCRAGERTSRYVLQRINHQVFTDPVAMMDNIRRVTAHIQQTLTNQGSHLASRQLTVVGTHDDAAVFRCELGNYWRVYNRIENAVTYDILESPKLAREAASMFGGFQRMLTDLPGPQLHETIVDFHTTPKRLKAFQAVLARDPENRAADCRAEIDFIAENAEICGTLLAHVDTGEIPLRITHNDTKINNVMIDDDTHTGVCVIDLDTVMPGLSLYDFGDMVRTATNPADEDERNLSKVIMRMDMFEMITEGFVRQTHSFLTPTERKYLTFAGKLITFEQMMRFCSDHLAGDVYYKIHRLGHNLDRARTQMKLMQSIISQEDRMNALVDSVFDRLA